MGKALKIDAYFTQHQPETQRLRVIAQDHPSVNLLCNHKPGYYTRFSNGVLFVFRRSEQTITLLHRLGVRGELH